MGTNDDTKDGSKNYRYEELWIRTKDPRRRMA